MNDIFNSCICKKTSSIQYLYLSACLKSQALFSFSLCRCAQYTSKATKGSTMRKKKHRPTTRPTRPAHTGHCNSRG